MLPSERRERLSMTYALPSTAADLVERSVSETLTYYAFPDIHWQKIQTDHHARDTAPHPSCRSIPGRPILSRTWRPHDSAASLGLHGQPNGT